MNSDKAREYFSAYAEGTLDAGLQQSLEQRLRSDSALMAEFRGFQGTLDELQTLKDQPIEIPFDLHERITSKIDRHVFEQKQTKTAAWGGWIRNLSFAGLAAAAIFGAVLGINARMSVAPAGPAPFSSAVDQLQISVNDTTVNLQYLPSKEHTLSVRSGTTGAELRHVVVTPEGWSNALENSQPDAAIFEVRISGEPVSTYIAVPGRNPLRVASGEGTIKEFARALAGYYREPIALKTSKPDERVKWDFKTTEGIDAATKVLDSQRFSVENRRSGVLWIEEN